MNSLNYRSIGDMAFVIRSNIYKIPRDIQLIVGIPRSGVLAASVIGLYLNKRICDLPSYLAGVTPQIGITRNALDSVTAENKNYQHILVVDDSVNSGRSMDLAKASLSEVSKNIKITYCGVFVDPRSIDKCDIALEILDAYRTFEWNTMHRADILINSCVDIDGVICVDPSEAENDDAEQYIKFLENTKPLIVPSYEVGSLVTSRLEKYRSHTEKWLQLNGIKYKSLYMLDLPSGIERRRTNCHASFKAQVYKSLHDSNLFIESERSQAIEIANISGKPSLCFKTQEFFNPCTSILIIKNNLKKSIRLNLQKTYKNIANFIRFH